MTIKGQLQAKEINDYGYARIKVAGSWYGADKKGEVSGEAGDIVEFEPYKNAKGYDTFKSVSFKKVAGKPAGSGPVDTGPVASKDEFWAKKEARDVARDPQIAYQGAYDRALTFADLALRNGAFGAFEKAKPTAKLAILEAFVAEYADKILGLVYAVKIPTGPAYAEPAGDTETETADEESDKWN